MWRAMTVWATRDRGTEVRSVTAAPGCELEFRKALAEQLLVCFVHHRVLPVCPPISSPVILLAAVAQGLKAVRLLFRKTFPVHSIECQGKPSSLKSGSLVAMDAVPKECKRVNAQTKN